MSKANKWKQKAQKAQAELNELKKKYQESLIVLERVKQQSLHDELTSLPNRRYFNQYLEQQWTTCERANLPLGLLLCDLDNFKAYNDYFGHQKGDECLAKVARALTSVTKRKQDLVARFGGEEFAIILPNTKLEGVRKLAKNFLKSIANLKIATPEFAANRWVTISIGGNVIVPRNEGSIEKLIRIADSTLYMAKDLGKNQSIIYGDTFKYHSSNIGLIHNERIISHKLS